MTEHPIEPVAVDIAEGLEEPYGKGFDGAQDKEAADAD